MEDAKKDEQRLSPVKTADKGDEAVFETVPRTIVKPIYRIDERPKTWWETIIYGWQTTIVDFTPFAEYNRKSFADRAGTFSRHSFCYGRRGEDIRPSRNVGSCIHSCYP